MFCVIGKLDFIGQPLSALGHFCFKLRLLGLCLFQHGVEVLLTDTPCNHILIKPHYHFVQNLNPFLVPCKGAFHCFPLFPLLCFTGISGSELIPLEDELELVRQYLNIQEIRFEDRFVCEIDVDERFQHCIVPKMVLQPLVENAIIHGVADLEEGYIKLWAEADGGDLLLRVSDNGRGIAPEVLARLEQHQDIPGGHLGLTNVDHIIRLYYGADYGLSASSDGKTGSCVTLRLPMKKGDGYAEGTDR